MAKVSTVQFPKTIGTIIKVIPEQRLTSEIAVDRKLDPASLSTTLEVGVALGNRYHFHSLKYNEEAYTAEQELQLARLLAQFLAQEFSDE